MRFVVDTKCVSWQLRNEVGIDNIYSLMKMMEYIMEEMPDIHKTGEKKYYPKVKHARRISHNTIVNLFRDVSTMSRSSIEGVMKELPEVLNMYLSQGHSVKIEGFGTFDVILGRLTEKEMANKKKRWKVHANMSGVYIKKINFLPDPEWMLKLRGSTELCHGKNIKEQFGMTLTEEDRREIAMECIKKKGSMSVRDYMRRTGTERVTAERDLKKFCEDAESGIRCVVEGDNKVYVKA